MSTPPSAFPPWEAPRGAYGHPGRPLVLAPLAEITHAPLRMLIRRFGGCDLLFTEMFSASMLVRAPHKSVFLIQDPSEDDLVHQIAGSDPHVMADAAILLRERGATRLDINMGCSAPAILRKGEGAALAADRPRALSVVSAVREVFPGHLSVKMRLGETDDPASLAEFARALADAGVQTLALHPRLRGEKFKRSARWARIRQLRECVPIPVVGNGDVRLAEDARRMLQETGCDGMMAGRGAISRPWLFAEIASGHGLSPDPREVLQTFGALLRNYLPEEIWMPRYRLFVAWFSLPLFFGHTLATSVRGATSLDEAEGRVAAFFASLGESTPGQP